MLSITRHYGWRKSDHFERRWSQVSEHFDSSAARAIVLPLRRSLRGQPLALFTLFPIRYFLPLRLLILSPAKD